MSDASQHSKIVDPHPLHSKRHLVTEITGNRFRLCYFLKHRRECSKRGMGGKFVPRALNNHYVWLAVAYIGLIFLMARAYS